MIRSEGDNDAARRGRAVAFPGRTGASGHTGSAVAAATERFAAMRDQIIPRAAARAFQHPAVSAAAQRAAELAETARTGAAGSASAGATDIDESANEPVGGDAKVVPPRLEEATQMAMTSWLPKVGQVVSTIAAAVATAAQSAPSGATSAKDRVAQLVAATLGDPGDTDDIAGSVTATKEAAVAADPGPRKGSAWRRVAALGLIAAGAAALVKVIRDSQPQHDPWATPLEPEGSTSQVSRRPYDPADAGPAAARAVVKERVTTAAETVKERSAETVETVKDKVTAVTETAKERSVETVETVKDKVTAATETAKETASHARSTVAERVEHLKSRAGTPAVPGSDAETTDLVQAPEAGDHGEEIEALEAQAPEADESDEGPGAALDVDDAAAEVGPDGPQQT